MPCHRQNGTNMTTINRYLLKITGAIELDQNIDEKQDAILNIPISIYEVSYKNQQDGTVDKSFKAKATGPVEVRQCEKLIHGKDRNSMSKKLRDRVWWHSQGLNIVDTESYYEQMIKIFMTDKFLDYASALIDKDKLK
jgi:hypothetical protein